MRSRAKRSWLLAAALILTAPAHAGGLAILETELQDNGDHDGYADTNETVALWLTVKNTTTQPLTGVVAHLAIASGSMGTVCVTDHEALVGDLPAGATLRAAEPLVFNVRTGQDRTTLGKSPYDAFTATFDLSFTASPAAAPAVPGRLVLDLDLDVTGTGPPTTVTEGFESGLGIFEIQNLDFGRHDTAHPRTGASYGFRCQYHSDCEQSSCDFTNCIFGGSAAAADATWWRIDGRAYTGGQSLYFGQALNPGPGHTTPTAALEAAATAAPIHLARVGAPTLTFKHQASFLDERTIVNPPPGPNTALDRGAVAVRLADGSGAPVGPWFKIDPSVNAYDNVATSYFSNCTFDPIDDGSQENDYYTPIPPARVDWRGPSSTCADERVFSFIGSTSGAFDPAALGRADGPGLAGSAGPGTWIETRFDLSRFRGRSVRLRFLATTTAIGTSDTWVDVGVSSTHPGEDGWWIDDVAISGASATAGTVTNDTRDNSALTVDADLDGVDDRCDDNCVGVANADQADLDLDGAGDLCDTCTDSDGDGFGNPGFPASTCPLDNCPLVANPTQADSDSDGNADACDNCPSAANADQANSDTDGLGNACDNCVTVANANQANSDGDAFGNVCDPCPIDPGNDADADGRCANVDNCPTVSNADQADLEPDGVGDVCDTCTDSDGDGFGNPGFPASTCPLDNCPLVANPSQADTEADGFPDACDNCPSVPNADQANADGDPAGDVCDCAPSDAFRYPNAPERNDGLDNNCPGEADYGIIDEISGTIGFFSPTNKYLLSWPAQAGATLYTLAVRVGFTYATIGGCSSQFLTGTSANYPGGTAPGSTTFFLVRAQSPRIGSWGRSTAGVPRTVSCATPP